MGFNHRKSTKRCSFLASVSLLPRSIQIDQGRQQTRAAQRMIFIVVHVLHIARPISLDELRLPHDQASETAGLFAIFHG